MERRTLITGTSGFMGSHLSEIIPCVGYDKNSSQYTHMVGDILNRKKLFQELRKIDTVYHFAALADLDKSWSNPRETIKVNVLGTMNVLEACRLNNVKNFYFASSLYADSDVGSLYGYTKKMGELLVKAYHKQCGINYCIMRFGTLYGTRSDESNSIYKYLKQALAGEIKYKGTGEEVREYIHVKDACKIVSELPCNNQTVMITGHQRLRVKEVLDMMKELLGVKTVRILGQSSLAHYNTISQRKPDEIKRIFPVETRDFGASLLEIAEEINSVHI